jgi:hypothetical protein
MIVADRPPHLLTGSDLRATPNTDPLPFGASMSDADVRPVSPPTSYDLASDNGEAAALRWAHRVVDQFQYLPPNWDSYGGVAVDEETADFAARLLAFLVIERVSPPQAFPTSDGGVSFEWHWPHLDSVMSVSPPGDRFSAFFKSEADQWEIDDLGDPRLWEAISALRR